MRLLHVAAGSNAAAEADPSELSALRAEGGWVWVDVVGSDPDEIERICRDFGFDQLAVEDVLSVTEHPKADDYPDHSLVVLHGVADDATQLRTVEFDAFLGPDYLVVFRREDLPGFDWIWDQLLQSTAQAPIGPDRLFALMCDAGASRFNVLVDALEQEVDELEERALAGDPAVIGEVHALRRDATRLRRVLVPQADTIRNLVEDEFPAVSPSARLRLRSVLNRYDRAAESLDASRGLLAAVLDTYRAVVAERANEVMKVLAVFSAILLPLSVIAGVYGMNFVNMPELSLPWAYFAVVGVMASVALSLWVYFARRGFIGGPRLARLPKAVGTGLAGVVRLTTRPIGSVARMLVGSNHGPEAADTHRGGEAPL